MNTKSASLEICSKCGRHGIIILAGGSKSMGFMTKQTGLSIINSYHDQKWITEQEYQKLYQAVSNSNLSAAEEPETALDEVTMMRLIWIYNKTKEGARLVEPYFACDKADPQLARGTLSEIAKANLN